MNGSGRGGHAVHLYIGCVCRGGGGVVCMRGHLRGCQIGSS
jgi:hypothetical protein